jgi:nitroreductase
MHQEPWAFVIVQDRALLATLSTRSKTLAANRTDHHELARDRDTRLPAMFADPNFDIFYQAPTLIVICAKSANAFATADCWLAAENLMLAATALGLATCPIGFALLGLADPEIKHALAIPNGVTPVAPIVVGHAAHLAPQTSRRPPEIVSWKK